MTLTLRGLLSTAFLACLLGNSSALAQDKSPKTGKPRFGDPTSTARHFQDYIYGVVKKIDPKANELVLDKTKFGIDQTYKLDSKTKVVRDGKPSSLDALKVGDQVFVEVKKDKKTGVEIAAKIVTGVGATPAP